MDPAPNPVVGPGNSLLSSAIGRFFLRSYAWETRPGAGRSFPPPRERAVFQTVLIALLPVIGTAASVIAILPRAVVSQWERPKLILGAIAVMLIAITHAFVTRVVEACLAAKPDLGTFRSRRDRTTTHVQFACVLLISVAMPWIAAWLSGIRS
jgi:hypothetical protein